MLRLFWNSAPALAATVLIGLAPAQGATKVVYGNVTDMTLSQAPMVAAKRLGYFAAEGLDVELLGFKGTGTLTPQILAKRVDIGYPNPDTFILSRAPGKEKLPLKYFYNMSPRSIWEFAVLADSPITSLKELDGKQIGVGALSFGNVPITKAQFKTLGISATMVPVGIGSAAFLALTSKRVDALNLFDAQDATMETAGISIRRLPQLPQYEALISNGFVAHDDLIRDKPEVIIGFGRAMAKATVFCEANRAACVKMFWKEYPNTKPSGDEAKVLADGTAIFWASFKTKLSFPPGPREYGKFDQQVWVEFAQALYEGGQLETKSVDVEACYTNTFVPKFSDFDAEQIRAQAAAFKD
jgi:NitT/TauT family transport system substrate-binding protein